MYFFIKNALKLLITSLLWPLKYLIPKGDIIIMQTYSPQIYCENTKYLYEYLSFNSKYDVYWVTENDLIIDYLNKNQLKYISRKKNPIEYLYVSLKAKIVIDSGDYYHNPFKIITNRVIKITTLHGNGPKDCPTPRKNLKETLVEIFNINKFDYINIPSSHMLNKNGRFGYHIPKEKLINLGYPRCDQFFDKDYVQKRYKEKPITNALLNSEYDGAGKIILYTPTWRPYKYDMPLNQLIGLDSFNQLDKYFIDNNIYVFYSMHTAMNIPKSLISTKRIKYIDNINRYPFYDTNSFMLEVDLLINDYSTTSTDFALLNRPQIFFMPDFDKYDQEMGHGFNNYKSVMPGKEVRTYKGMLQSIDHFINNPEEYTKEYQGNVDTYLKNYYDLKAGDSCKKFTEFINTIMSKEYKV